MFSYIAYGFRIDSEIALPELIVSTSTTAAEVTIRFDRLAPPGLEPTSTECYCHITDEEAYLAWKDSGTFLVREGREIIIDPIAGVAEQVLRLDLLGAVLGMLLHQRGLFVLHASAVEVNHAAIVFIGNRGWGKSTTAAAFHACDHPVISDDVTALKMDPTDGLVVLPGFPQLKLWSDTAASLGHDPKTLPLVHPEYEKHAYRFSDRFTQKALPLQCIYLLDIGSELEIEPLAPADALAALLPHWYGARFGFQLLHVVGLASHFLNCTQIINSVAVYRLKRQRSLSALTDIVRLVETHLNQHVLSH